MSFFATVVAWAGPVSRQQAQQQAKEFMASRGVVMTESRAAYKAPRKTTQNDEQAFYYVFNAGQDRGFVIISGDDRTEQVLGYCDNGTFDVANMPENMRSFLQGYADEIKWMDDNNIQGNQLNQAKSPRRIKPVRRAVSPILKSLWNQGDPYNRFCPEYYNASGGRGEHAVTGCVATAIAQVINFWKYPVKTRGNIPSHSNTYNTKTASGKDTTIVVTLPRIKGGTVIDWDNMLDVYDASATDAQKDAVANLMLMVGQSVKMGYGASSGAVHGSNVPDILKQIFGFDDSAWCASRDNYTVEGWTDLLYGELAAGRPISFSGHSTGGGHAFVVDGYDGEGLFHLNWGWGGGSNGYFRITVLNPGDNSGIGASSSSDGYSMGQNAIIGLKLPDDVKETFYANMTINGVEQTTDGNGNPAIKANYINWTGAQHTFDTGIGFLREDGNFEPIGTTNNFSINANYLRTYTYPVTGLEPGTYKVAPISKQKDATQWGTCFNIETEWFDVHVEDDYSIYMKWIRPIDGLSVEKIEFPGNLKAGTQQNVNVTFRSSLEEYFGTIYLFASTTEEKGSNVSRSAVSVPKNGEEMITFFFKPEANVEANYHIWLATDDKGDNVIGEGIAEITKAGVTPATIAQNLSFEGISGSNLVETTSETVFRGNFVAGNITLKNNGKEDFNGQVELTIWKEQLGNRGWYNTCAKDVLTLSIPAGRSVNAPYMVQNLETNRHYGFSVHNVTANASIRGLYSWYDVLPGIVTYYSDGRVIGAVGSSTYNVPRSGVTAVDLRGVEGVTKVKPSSTAGVLFYVDENAEIEGLEGQNIVRGGHSEEINIDDSNPFYAPVAFTADKVNYHRTLATGSTGKDNWESVVLPFAPTTVATADGKELRWQANEENEYDIYLKEFAYLTDDDMPQFAFVNKIEAEVPYVIAVPFAYAGQEIVFSAENVDVKSSSTMNALVTSAAYNFKGITVGETLENIWTINSEGTAFVPVKKTKVKPFRAYFVSKLEESAQPEQIVICDEYLTGVQTVAVEAAQSGAVYNLKGQKVADSILDNKVLSLPHGVYILNGKKVKF